MPIKAQAALICVLLALAGVSQAAETVVTPSFDLGGLYETNPTLNRVVEDSVLGLAIDGRIDFSFRTETTNATFVPRAFGTFYADEEDQDLENRDYYLPLTLSRQTQRSATGLRLGYSDVSIRNSELESAAGGGGGGNPELVFINDRQKRLTIDPSWSYYITPRTNFRVEAGYSDISYDNTFAIDRFTRFDYRYLYGNVSLDRSLDERIGLGVLLNASRFDAEEPNSGVENDSTTYGASLFLNYAFGQSWTGFLTLGGRDTQSEVNRRPDLVLPGGEEICFSSFDLACKQEFDGNTYVGEVRVSKTGERTDFDFSIGRDISPNSNGAETIRDTLRSTLRRQLTTNVSARLGLLYYAQTDAAELTSRERDYASADVTLRWRFTRQWSLRGSYRYVWVKDITTLTGEAQNTSASNNYVFLGVGWQGLGWRR